jgi:hypothetical protein
MLDILLTTIVRHLCWKVSFHEIVPKGGAIKGDHQLAILIFEVGILVQSHVLIGSEGGRDERDVKVQESHESEDPEERVDHEADQTPRDRHTIRVPVAGHLKECPTEEMEEEEGDEVFVIISPHSVANKGTEMVEFVNALILYLTMLGTDWSPDMTRVTHKWVGRLIQGTCGLGDRVEIALIGDGLVMSATRLAIDDKTRRDKETHGEAEPPEALKDEVESVEEVQVIHVAVGDNVSGHNRRDEIRKEDDSPWPIHHFFLRGTTTQRHKCARGTQFLNTQRGELVENSWGRCFPQNPFDLRMSFLDRKI